MSTERLYYTDSHLTEFDARVVSISSVGEGRSGVMLDRTAFYPTGGGQPCDTGVLGEVRVVECVDEEERGVLHIVEGAAPGVGEVVRGHIDWARRLDFMQQHTGQHILSQAFVELFQAETRGFRMLEEVSEIDVALTDASDERVARAVARANAIIWQDRAVRIHTVTAEEAAALPLRKDSMREGQLRIIEIEGFDMSPCGGTHARRTGEVGIIAVRSWERAKKMARLEFVAGGRVLADYNRANWTARAAAALFSVGRDDALASVARLMEENKQLARRVRALEESEARAEAQEILTGEMVRCAGEGTRILSRVFEGRDVESLKRLAQAVVAHPLTIALFAARDGDRASLVFARSQDADGADMNALMRTACVELEGRGGGRPEMAQGGGRHAARLEQLLQSLTRRLSA